MSDHPAPGTVFECAYPFVRKPYEVGGWGENEVPAVEMTWTPGVRFIQWGPEDTEAVHDGIGARIATSAKTPADVRERAQRLRDEAPAEGEAA